MAKDGEDWHGFETDERQDVQTVMQLLQTSEKSREREYNC